MRAHGSDRVRRGDGEQWLLASRLPKGWRARIEKTLTTPEHPGTAVLCEEQYYEVVAIAARGTGVEYQLEPWREEHVMRQVERYDGASEQARLDEHRRNLQRAAQRRGTLAFGLITGQFPAAVQEHFANELGIVAHRLTMISTVPAWALFGFCLWLVAGARLQKEVSPVPVPLLILCAALAAESALRFFVAWTQNRPMGSLAGVLLYSLYHAVAPRDRRVASPYTERGGGIQVDIPEEEELRGALTLREPFLTLLTTAEQQQLARRFDYDYRQASSVVAWICLGCAAAGAFTMIRKLQVEFSIVSAFSCLVAMIVAGEQPLRMMKLRSGPAGSVLAPLVRPFARRLLQAPPPAAPAADAQPGA